MASSASGLCSTPSSPVRLADLLSAVTEHVESLKTTNPSSDRLLTDEGHLAKLRAFAFPLLAENPDAELPLEELAALVGDHAFAPNRQPLYPPITRKLSDEDEPKKRPTLVNKSSTDDFAARTRTVPVLKTSISASRIGAQVKRRSRGPSGSLASGFIPNLHDGQSQNSNAALAAPRTTANSTSLPSPPLTPDLDKQLRQPAISQRASISDTAVAAPQPSNPTSPPSLIPLRLDSSASSTSGTGDEADKLRACMIDVTKRLYDAEKRLSVSQEQSESRIAALQERIKIWQNDVASTKRQLADLRAVEKAQVAQIETMESSAWKLARELEEKRSECQALRSLLEEKESYELKLVAELRRKEDESATKESSLKLLESEIRRFITENGRLEARMAALKSHVDSSESLMSRIISKSSEAVVSTDAADGESFASTASMTTLVSSFSLALDPVPSPHCAPIHRRDDSDDSGFPGFGASSYGTHTNNENDRFDFRPSTPTRQSPVERSLKDIESVIDMFEREIHEARETAKEAQKELSVMSLKEQELSELVSSLQNELIWYREEAEAEVSLDRWLCKSHLAQSC
ncbi:hypothetical protein DFJ73DRAFT_445961 [Zopfochytrium polystomum]|nr:hypothetical protein DFJ73DRAFT_445961 [Zopfochytrium polystomum]